MTEWSEPLATNHMKTILKIFLLLLPINSVFAQKDAAIYPKDNDGFVIYNTRAFYRDIEIYDSKKEEIAYRKSNETEGCPVLVNIDRNPLSLVGAYFSYEYFFGSETGCGYYGNTITVETIDLQTLEKVNLTDLFTEESILNAFKNDSWLSSQLNISSTKVKMGSIKSFDEILGLLNGLNNFIELNAYSFTIIDTKMKDGKIGVRFVGSQPLSNSSTRKHLQLGLWLVPTQLFKENFLNDTKFVLGAFESGLTQ